MKTTQQEAALKAILKEISKQHGTNYLLILTPDGNGNMSVPVPGRDTYNQHFFKNISALLSTNQTLQ
jgi:hypothetical protein